MSFCIKKSVRFLKVFERLNSNILRNRRRYVRICDMIHEKIPQARNFIFELMIDFNRGRFYKNFAKKINPTFETTKFEV